MYKIIWRDYKGISRTGVHYTQEPHYPLENGQESGDLLLRLFLSMPKEGRTALSYDEACHRVCKQVCACVDEERYDFLAWLLENWVQWLSEQGYYVAFTERDYIVLNAA